MPSSLKGKTVSPFLIPNVLWVFALPYLVWIRTHLTEDNYYWNASIFTLLILIAGGLYVAIFITSHRQGMKIHWANKVIFLISIAALVYVLLPFIAILPVIFWQT